MSVQVQIDPPNGRSPKRLITVSHGATRVSDTCDPLDGFQRGKLVERIAGRLGIPSHLVADVDEQIVQAAEADTPAEPFDFRMMTCSELVKQDFTVDYWIDRILAMKQPCILAGPKKTLKTSLLIDLLLAIARGGCFLGMFRAQRAEAVGLFTAESGLATISETIVRQCRAAGYDPNEIDNLHLSAKVPCLENREHIEALKREIIARQLKVAALDPVYKMTSGDNAGNLFAQGRLLAQLDDVCQETGCTFVLAHHARKTGRIDRCSPLDLEDISWSGYQEWARQWLLVSRSEDYRHDGEHRLWMSSGGSAGHAGFWQVHISEGTRATPGGRFWRAKVTDASEAHKQQKDQAEQARENAQRERAVKDLDEARRAVVAAMVRAGKPLDKADTIALTPIQKQRAVRAWGSLVADGTLIPTGERIKKENHQSYPTYRVETNPYV